MKILYIMNHVGQGGAALALYDLIVELKKTTEVEPVVITGKENELNDKLTRLGVENYVFPFKNFVSTSHKPIFIWKMLLRTRHDLLNPIAFKLIEKKLKIETFDIIHSNLNRIDIGAKLASKYNKPHIWHVREHGKDGFNTMSIYRNPCMYMNSFNSTFVAISKSVHTEWEKLGLDAKRVQIIYDGVRDEKLEPLSKKNIKTQIIFLGGYDETKGQEQLIKAILQLPVDILDKIHVSFFGNGNMKYKNNLIKMIEGYENVFEFNDYRADIYDVLPQYDIGINCSRAEGFGRITVEYMLAGLCPVVSNKGANVEIVEDEKCGIVYKYEDISDLTRKLKELIESEDKIKYYAVNARKRALSNFTMKKHADTIWKLYNEVLERKM